MLNEGDYTDKEQPGTEAFGARGRGLNLKTFVWVEGGEAVHHQSGAGGCGMSEFRPK